MKSGRLKFPETTFFNSRFCRCPVVGERAEEYTLMPFWFINKLEPPEKVAAQLEEMWKKGLRGVFIHARRGIDVPNPIPEPRGKISLLTGGRWDKYFTEERLKRGSWPYMKEPWWEIVSAALRKAEELGMFIGIYDELDWPSGTVGMELPRRRELRHKLISRDGRVLTSPYYVDVLSERAAEEFIRRTHEEYWRRYRRFFGKVITHFFSDEVTAVHHLLLWNADLAPWTDELERDPGRERIRCLWSDAEGCRKFRFRYWERVSELLSRFHRRIRDWCREHGVKYTGHVFIEEPVSLQVKAQGNIFDQLRSFDIPGIDQLTKVFGGCYPRIAASVAHFMGSRRVLCEAFGFAGWSFRLGHAVRITNWLVSNGVNLIVPHAVYLSVEGFRKYECPPSHAHLAWWEKYGAFNEYVKRLTYLASLGEHSPDVAVYYPVESMFASFDMNPLNRELALISNELEALHVLMGMVGADYDFVDYRMLREAVAEEGALRIRRERYRALVLPAVHTLAEESEEVILQLISEGVRVIFTTFVPVWRAESGEASRLSRAFGIDAVRVYKSVIRPIAPVMPALQEILRRLDLCENAECLFKLLAPKAVAPRVESLGGSAYFISSATGLWPNGWFASPLRRLIKPKEAVSGFVRIFRRRVGDEEIIIAMNSCRGRAKVAVGKGEVIEISDLRRREVRGSLRLGSYELTVFSREL